MKIKVEIPTSLADIKLSQYKKYLNIQLNNDDERFLQAKMIEIFCGIPLKDVMKLKYNDTNEISSILTTMFEQKPKLVERFKLNGVEYGFHPVLDDMSLGEYIDLDTYIGDWENIERAMNVLYRPIENTFKNKYSIKEYEVEGYKDVLDMPMDAALSSIFFLWNLGLELSQTMMSYLDNNQNIDLTEYLTSEINGDGINQYMDSLREILQDFRISQN